MPYIPYKARRWQRFKRRELQKVGYSPRQRLPPRYWNTFNWAQRENFQTNTLYCAQLFKVNRNDYTAGTDQINRRTKNWIWTKGVRIRLNFKNLLDQGQTPLYVNFAIIHSGEFDYQLGVTTEGSYGTGPEAQVNFFRNYGEEQQINFDNIALSGVERHTLPICRDEQQVLYHKRFVLGCKSTELKFSSGEGRNYKSWSKYFPLKRQIRYDDNTGASAFNKIWLLWWCTPFDFEGQTTGPLTKESALDVIGNCISVYRG